jgi:hypothetical protein
MGKGRRSRMDLRREAEAVEARKREQDEETEGEEGGEEEEEDEEEEDEGEAEPEPEPEGDAEGDDEGGDDDEERPKKKKAKKPAKKAPAKKPTTKRTRAQKDPRTRAVWVVFDNASKRVDTFPYNQKAEAEALLAKKLEEKKGTFYINLVKEEIKEDGK